MVRRRAEKERALLAFMLENHLGHPQADGHGPADLCSRVKISPGDFYAIVVPFERDGIITSRLGDEVNGVRRCFYYLTPKGTQEAQKRIAEEHSRQANISA